MSKGLGLYQKAIRAVHGSRNSRGLTLVELLVTMGILVVLASLMFWVVKEVVKHWTTYERQRIVYERASIALDRISDDLAMMQPSDPKTATEIKSYVVGYYDADTGRNYLRFTRSFEGGPERALINSDLRALQPGTENDPNAKQQNVGTGGGGAFTGLRSANYGPLGGMARVDYFVEDGTLYRGVLAPVPALDPGVVSYDNGVMLNWLRPVAKIPIAEDVLYLSFDYWTQITQDWAWHPSNSKTRGPEKVWDSTRSMKAGPLSKFLLHADASTFVDPTSHVFPQKIRITVTVDAPMPRCVNTKTLDDINEYDGMIFVDSTQGFPKGGGEDAYILIEDEWVHYKEKRDNGFVCDERGARGTVPRTHKAESLVRIGRTFHRIVNIPCYREDERIWLRR